MLLFAMQTLAPNVRASLARLAKSSDRTSPTVFAGREDEFELLNDAVEGARRDESGHTVVIQGVPGAGKTALLNEYAARLLAASASGEKPIIPVPLQPGDINAPSAAIVQAIDRQFREFDASDEWCRKANRAVGGASLLGNALFAALTRRDFNDFRASAKAPDSLPAALEDYVAFRFDHRQSTIVLLVDEAQNLHDTTRVRDHLGTLHSGVKGSTQVLLACFGLANTTDRLRELGLSRLASGHVRSIGALSDEDARRTVTGALEVAFDHAFDDGLADDSGRERWIGAAATVILSESANFPHHLTNGCRSLAAIVLDEGIGNEPPVRKLRAKCRDHRREYHDARLRPWARHMTALVQAFGKGKGEDDWTPIDDLLPTVMASDNFGRPVDEETAIAVIEELCASGYLEESAGVFRPVLPSLSSHFAHMQRSLAPNNKVVRAVQAAVSDQSARSSGA